MPVSQPNDELALLHDMTKSFLQLELRNQVFDSLLADELARYEAEITPIIRERVSKISLDGVESLTDRMALKNELRVSISVDGDSTERVLK